MNTVSVPAARRLRALPLSRLLEGGRLSFVELVAATALLLALGVAAFGSHIVSGGFYSDDWANAATHRYSPDGSLDGFWDITSYRPLLVLYVPLTHVVFGAHFGVHIAWAVCLGVLMSALLYAVLRALGMARLHAFAVAALVLLFPWSDSTRLWATSSMAHLSISLYLLGTLAAIRGLRARSWAWHAGAVALYLASILTYEIAAGPIVLSVLLYAVVAGPRAAAPRWAADLCAALPVLLLVTRDSSKDVGGVSHWIDHGRQIVDEGVEVFAAAAFPWGPPGGATAVGVAAVVLLAGLAVRRALPRGDADALEIRRWLAFAAGGAVFALAAWAVFVPAESYYSPLTAGVGNRVNVLAAVGLVLCAYGAIVVAARLAFRGLPRWGARVPLLAALAAVVVGVGYVDVLDRHKENWDEAYEAEQAVLASIAGHLGSPPPGSTVYTFNHPAYYAPGVPVFAAWWDLNGALKVHFRDGSLSGYPPLPNTRFVCGDAVLHPTGDGYGPQHGAPYGRAIFVDVAGNRAERIDDRRECRAAAASYRPGPFELTAG